MNDSSLIKARTYRGFTIEIHYDLDCSNDSPRDWDNGTTLCLTHGRYKLPNEGDIPFDDLDSMDEVVAYVQANFAVVGDVYPVSMTDHGMTSYYLGSPRDPWDAGYVGVFFATVEGQKMCGFTTDQVEEVLKGDLETFTQWANGWVYGYVVEDPEGREVGALWSIYDDSPDFSYIVGEAESVIDGEIIRVNESLASLGLR